jgi:hypothetical protein
MSAAAGYHFLGMFETHDVCPISSWAEAKCNHPDPVFVKDVGCVVLLPPRGVDELKSCVHEVWSKNAAPARPVSDAATGYVRPISAQSSRRQSIVSVDQTFLINSPRFLSHPVSSTRWAHTRHSTQPVSSLTLRTRSSSKSFTLRPIRPMRMRTMSNISPEMPHSSWRRRRLWARKVRRLIAFWIDCCATTLFAHYPITFLQWLISGLRYSCFAQKHVGKSVKQSAQATQSIPVRSELKRTHALWHGQLRPKVRGGVEQGVGGKSAACERGWQSENALLPSIPGATSGSCYWR